MNEPFLPRTGPRASDGTYPRSRRPLLAAVLLLGAALSGGVAPRSRAQDAAPEPLSAFPQSLLAVRERNGTIVNLKIWTADTPAREEQGLMFVRDMDDHAGMLFLFAGDQRVSMWMKNTFMSLDMVFTDARGTILTIVPHTTPQSLDLIEPQQPARAVLELKGGAAQTLGIRVGDRLLHASFRNVN